MIRFATTDRVVLAWLALVDGLAPGMVGETLPTDITTWSADGFITPNTAGGNSNIYVPVISPVITMSCWAVDPDTGEPPWNLAKNLAETVRAACQNRDHMGDVLTLPDCDQQVRVFSAYLVGEPRKSYADNGDYACVVVDVHVDWIVS